MSNLEPITLVPTISMCGDSITCYAWQAGGTGAALADLYQRKLDVVNRGLGGYNTKWTIPIVERWLPRVGSNQPPTTILTLWFGANDACLPHSPQYVPIEEFKANLHKICNYLTDEKSIYYSPATKIIFLTPPPVDAVVRATELASRTPAQVPDREYERTHLYAIAVQDVARERGLPVVDCWTLIAQAAGRDGGLAKYLSDGLHLSPDGYAIVTAELIRIITEHYPEVMWSNLPNAFPEWASVPAGSLGDQFKIENYKRI